MGSTKLCMIAGGMLLASTALAFAQTAPMGSTPAPSAAAPAAAAPPAASALPPPAAVADAYKTVMVCRSMPPPPGSLIGRPRVCLTQYEWDRQRLEAQRNVSNAQLRDRATSY